MDRFVSGLRSRSDEVRARTARDLKRYVTTEMQEGSNEEYNTFFDKLNQNIFDLVSSSEVHEKKGAILAIGEGRGVCVVGREGEVACSVTVPSSDSTSRGIQSLPCGVQA